MRRRFTAVIATLMFRPEPALAKYKYMKMLLNVSGIVATTAASQCTQSGWIRRAFAGVMGREQGRNVLRIVTQTQHTCTPSSSRQSGTFANRDVYKLIDGAKIESVRGLSIRYALATKAGMYGWGQPRPMVVVVALLPTIVLQCAAMGDVNEIASKRMCAYVAHIRAI